MRMGVGLDLIMDGRKVMYLYGFIYYINPFFFFSLINNKVINGLIPSMWCMIYLG